ncbi:response regulator [Variovorax sp. GT1P44]|uniref:response regulator n=1 Tax=Variovorax sp. GT1P44 TaxID=3443742 RepID=UPI003F486779
MNLPGAANPAAAGTAERANILIVDDLPEKLLVFQTVLEDLGQNLVLVRSGAEALRELLQREFAVIMLDVNMPGMDGFETAALIRQHRRSAHTPIIFITSYADEMQTARGYSLGAVDYMLSPLVPEVLRSKVSVFVSLYLMQREVQQQSDARAAMMAAEAARRVAEQRDRRSAFLAHASRALSVSLEVQVAACELAELLVPAVAAASVVMPSDPDFLPCKTVVAARARAGGRPIVSTSGTNLDERLAATLAGAIEDRCFTAVAPAALNALDAGSLGLAGSAVSLPPLRWAGALPLIFGGRVLGAMLLLSGDDATEQGGPDQGLLEEIAVRAAAAFENARLYRVLQREIAERKAAQEELQQADQRKDEFLAMMSHELRNPLAPIHTAVEVIRRVAAPSPKVSWALDVASRQLQQMTRLIEELLDVTRISQGKITLKRESMDLNKVIAQSVETIQPAIKSRHQVLSVSIPERPAWLHGDAARLTQVVANLLHNASKYSPEGTHISLAAEIEDLEVVVTVRDQGIGIDEELLPRIFDLFAQGKRGLDRAQGGLGVGLTLARRLTEMHGGRIEAISFGRDKGSEFKVRLPCITLVRQDHKAVQPEHAIAADHPQCVLVVDDNRDAAHAMAAMLEIDGHTVVTASNGEEALVLAAAHAPTVVLLDIGLPVLDGYQVARRLRAMRETEHSLLIALTGYGQKEDRQAAFDAGFNHHFVKPADAVELLSCIRAWCKARESGGFGVPAAK